MRAAECIITGVIVVDGPPMKGVTPVGVPGDLFQQGDMYIVNANPNATWEKVDKARARIIYMAGSNWERRSVYVIAKEDAILNQNALDYIGGR